MHRRQSSSDMSNMFIRAVGGASFEFIDKSAVVYLKILQKVAVQLTCLIVSVISVDSWLSVSEA